MIDRPIDQVFGFLGAGTNDSKFSPRVEEMRKTTDGPVGVGTVPEGGYDLQKISDTQTTVTIHNTLEGRGVGKVIVIFAVRAAIKDAPAFAQRIKSAVEAS